MRREERNSVRGSIQRDQVKALILERKQAERRTYKWLADMLNISQRTMYRRMKQHSDRWETQFLVKLCLLLNVTETQYEQVVKLRRYGNGI